MPAPVVQVGRAPAVVDVSKGQPGAPGAPGLNASSLAILNREGDDGDDVMLAMAAASAAAVQVTKYTAGLQTTVVVTDSSYSMLPSDTNVVAKGLTAQRTVTLPLASQSRYARIGSGDATTTLTRQIAVAVQGADVLNAGGLGNPGPLYAATAPNQSTVYLSDGVSNWYAWSDLSSAGGTLVGYVQMAGTRPQFRAMLNTSATVADTDDVITFLSNGGGLAVNLQAMSTHAQELWIIDANGAAAINPIAITPSGSDTINGVNAPFLLNSRFGIVHILPAGNNAWSAVQLGPNVPIPFAQITGAPSPSLALIPSSADDGDDSLAMVYASNATALALAAIAALPLAPASLGISAFYGGDDADDSSHMMAFAGATFQPVIGAQSVGSATQIPVLGVNAFGQITSISTATPSGGSSTPQTGLSVSAGIWGDDDDDGIPQGLFAAQAQFQNSGLAWTRTTLLVFNVAGTYTVYTPPWAQWCEMVCCGNGGAGGSGGLGTSGTAATGGGGGGAADWVGPLTFPCNQLAATLTVVIPAAALGGAAQTVASNNGNAGASGTSAYCWDGSSKYYVWASGGNGGGAGQKTGVAATGGAVLNLPEYGGLALDNQGNAGQGSSATGGAGTAPTASSPGHRYEPSPGPSGGGVTTTPAGSAGAGGQQCLAQNKTGGGAAGAAATGPWGMPFAGGFSGGSGAGSSTGNGGAGQGGPGYGFGGAGGGAAIGANQSGAGSNGGLALVALKFG